MKLLLTVAHPDDETFGCGSVLAYATARGVESVVVCATRGELGEMAGLAAGEAAPANLGDIREAELRAAAEMLGVSRVELLGWLDSGTTGPAAAGALVAAPPRDVESAIAAIVEELRPDVVVTLDGSDGHRDHAVVRDATLAALQATTWRPSRTYLWCLPRSLLADFAGVPGIGTRDEDITTLVDVSDLIDLRWKAIRAHASQHPPYDAMSPELARRRSFPPIAFCASTRRGQAASPSVTGFPPESVSASAPATAAATRAARQTPPCRRRSRYANRVVTRSAQHQPGLGVDPDVRRHGAIRAARQAVEPLCVERIACLAVDLVRFDADDPCRSGRRAIGVSARAGPDRHALRGIHHVSLSHTNAVS